MRPTNRIDRLAQARIRRHADRLRRAGSDDAPAQADDRRLHRVHRAVAPADAHAGAIEALRLVKGVPAKADAQGVVPVVPKAGAGGLTATGQPAAAAQAPAGQAPAAGQPPVEKPAAAPAKPPAAAPGKPAAAAPAPKQ